MTHGQRSHGQEQAAVGLQIQYCFIMLVSRTQFAFQKETEIAISCFSKECDANRGYKSPKSTGSRKEMDSVFKKIFLKTNYF